MIIELTQIFKVWKVQVVPNMLNIVESTSCYTIVKLSEHESENEVSKTFKEKRQLQK